VRPGQIATPAARANNSVPTGRRASAPSPRLQRIQQLYHDPARRADELVVVSGTFDDIRLIKSIVEKIDVLLPRSRSSRDRRVSLSDTDQDGLTALAHDRDGPERGTSITGATGALADDLRPIVTAAVTGRPARVPQDDPVTGGVNPSTSCDPRPNATCTR